MKKFKITTLVLLILMTSLIIFRFGSALYQERNPLPILISIMRLELFNNDFEQFDESKTRHRYVSANLGNSQYNVIKDFMNEKGWNFKEQIGSGLAFENNGEILVVETRQFSKHYILWNVPVEKITEYQ